MHKYYSTFSLEIQKSIGRALSRAFFKCIVISNN